MSVIFCYSLIYIVEAIILVQYVSNLFEYKTSHFKRYFLLIALLGISFFISFLHVPFLNSIAFLLTTFIFMKLTTNESNIILLFHSILLLVIMSLSELIVMGLFSAFSYNIYNKLSDYISLYAISFLSKLLYFVVTYFISHKLSHIKDNIRFSPYEMLTLIIVPVFSAFITLTVVYLFIFYEIKSPFNYMISLCCFFILLINILVFSLYEHIKQKNAQIAELKLQSQRDADSAEYYRTLSEQDEQQKVLIHDIKKHLYAIADLNEHHETDKIAAYLTRVLGSPELQHSVRVCDNDLLNSLICRYQKICLMKKIAFHIDIRSKCIDFVSYDDLSILFGNLMDNAVESAEKMAVNPFIELSVFRRENTNMTIITLIDSCRVNPIDKDGNLMRTKKPNPQFHGFGVKSIANVVKRYDGEMTFYYDDPSKTFHMIMMLRNPDDYIYRH